MFRDIPEIEPLVLCLVREFPSAISDTLRVFVGRVTARRSTFGSSVVCRDVLYGGRRLRVFLKVWCDDVESDSLVHNIVVRGWLCCQEGGIGVGLQITHESRRH